MQFKQVSDTEFTTHFSNVSDMGENSSEGIRFFNQYYETLVKHISVNWDEKTITFVILDRDREIRDVEDRMRGTEHSILWTEKSYVITWKKQNMAKSYHSSATEKDLRELYKDKVAYLCNYEEGKYEIDSIDEG